MLRCYYLHLSFSSPFRSFEIEPLPRCLCQDLLLKIRNINTSKISIVDNRVVYSKISNNDTV